METTDQAFPGTPDTRTIAEVDAQIKAENALTAATNEAAEQLNSDTLWQMAKDECRASECGHQRFGHGIHFPDRAALLRFAALVIDRTDAERAASPFAALSRPVDVDALAQEIRRIDGANSLGAGALAERIVEWLGTRPVVEQTIPATQPVQAQWEAEPVTVPADYLQGHADGLEWAALVVEAEDPRTGDWLHDDRNDLAEAIRRGPDMPPAAPAVDRGLSEALKLARPYVESASQRCYDGTNGHGIREEAKKRLAVIDDALAASAPSQGELLPGIKLVVDPSIPAGQAVLKQGEKELGRIVNIGDAPSQAEPVDHHCQHPGFNPYAGDACPACAPSQAGSCQASEKCPDQAGCLRYGCGQTGDGSLCHRFIEPDPPAGRTLTAAAQDVLAERERQVSVEGWTPEHDDQHSNGTLAVAAACYASPAKVYSQRFGSKISTLVPNDWPWDRSWWKPSQEPRRNLVKAGALILAEIERLDRAAASTTGGADHG